MAPNQTEEALWRGADQPARRAFGIDAVRVKGETTPVTQANRYHHPFAVLTGFECAGGESPARVLLIPPLSGHFPFLFRDLVLALLPDHDVSVLEWINARHVPADAGRFTLDDNIAEVVTAIRAAGAECHVIGICQGAIPALAATALLSQDDDPARPRSLTLIAAPVDPTANPTNVVRLLRARPLGWFEQYAFARVGAPYSGAGRRVYPAHYQLGALMAYFTRHLAHNGLLLEKIYRDDGSDPVHFPFIDGFTSVMDLPAGWFLDNVRTVFHERAVVRDALRWRGRAIDLKALRSTGLMTVEAEHDDIAAPGQTAAVHGLCPHLPAQRHERYLLPGGGHFSTFHGNTVRDQIAPRIRRFIAGN